ncbi:hypothetical protein JAB8_18000 [Janthinobacterium sp. HH106]|nr:hypothetical protein JAB8_18000 [Janthinobacterium sp. HH106]
MPEDMASTMWTPYLGSLKRRQIQIVAQSMGDLNERAQTLQYRVLCAITD